MTPTDDAIGALYTQAANLLAGATGTSSAAHADTALKTLTAFAHTGDQVSLGLFPLAFALLILHENFQAATTEGRFRVGYVLGRATVIAILVHPWTYGRLCGLITYAAGGHGGWFSSDTLLGSVSKSVDGLAGAWTDLAGDDPGVSDSIGALFHILPVVGLWLILVSCLLLAYIAGALLSLSQAILLSVLLAVGKTCITVTLVPGVALGSSWARALAKVAAWSTIGALITSLMVQAVPDLRNLVRDLAYMSMLRAAGQFVVLAVCTFAVPVITERIFSGAAPHGNAALEGLQKGWQGLQAMGGSGGSAPRSQVSTGPSASEGGGGFAQRPHKIPPSRLRQGLAAMGVVAAAPIAALDALRRRQRGIATDRRRFFQEGSAAGAHDAEPTPIAARRLRLEGGIEANPGRRAPAHEIGRGQESGPRDPEVGS